MFEFCCLLLFSANESWLILFFSRNKHIWVSYGNDIGGYVLIKKCFFFSHYMTYDLKSAYSKSSSGKCDTPNVNSIAKIYLECYMYEFTFTK